MLKPIAPMPTAPPVAESLSSSDADRDVNLSEQEAAATCGGAVSEVKAVTQTPTPVISITDRDSNTTTASINTIPNSRTRGDIDPENRSNWSPNLQNVLEQPPAAFPRHLLLAAMVFCVGFAAWAWLGHIEEVGHARGQLVPQGEVYKIHPVELNKVTHIKVKEGDAVKTGQLLVELDSKIAADEVKRLQQQLVAYQDELQNKQALADKTRLEARTRADIAAADLQAHSSVIAAALAKVITTRELLGHLQTQTAANQAQLETLQPLKAQTQKRLVELRADVAAHQARIERLKPLVEEGAIAKERLFEAEQALRDRTAAITQNQGELQQAQKEAERLQAQLASKQAEASTTQLETQQRIHLLEVEITQIKGKIAQTQNLLGSAKAKLKQQFLTAPVDGVVSSLNIRNIGEVVQPGQTIAQMTPNTAPLILSAHLPNQEAGFVKTGDKVQIKLDAYPYQDYGIISGKVTAISPDAKPDERLGAVYRIEVALDRSYVTANHQTIQFKPGQTASADIIIRRRRIADILLDPIRQLQKGGINL